MAVALVLEDIVLVGEAADIVVESLNKSLRLVRERMTSLFDGVDPIVALGRLL